MNPFMRSRSGWFVESKEGVTIRDHEMGIVAHMAHLRGPHGIWGRRTPDEVSANAHLMSASPDLAESLAETLRALRGFGWSVGFTGYEERVCERALKALEKARRKSGTDNINNSCFEFRGANHIQPPTERS